MKLNFESIYEHIGYLFYALASWNDELSTAQFAKLTDVIERIWKPMSNGDPGLHLHLVDCIHKGIWDAIENGMSSEHALSSFCTCCQINSLPFGQALKEKIMASVAEIQKEFPNSKASDLNKTALQQLLEKPVAV